VSVGGDGNQQISFTARTDIARFVSYVLTHLPPEQLKNRGFAIAGDNKVMSGLGTSVVVVVTDRRLNSRSIKYSRHMKKRPGRNCM
jgi:hypothetical protein